MVLVDYTSIVLGHAVVYYDCTHGFTRIQRLHPNKLVYFYLGRT